MRFHRQNNYPEQDKELSRHLLEIIVIRAIVLLLGLNLADHLSLLPERLHALSFLWFFNTIALSLTLIYLILWLSHKHRMLQLAIQIGIDLILATILVAYTHGIESPFVSFYLLIIIYCSLTLGRNGGMVGAAISTILYAGTIIAIRLDLLGFGAPKMDTPLTAFRISAHALGFWAVAYLGTYLHQRLQAIEGELKEKIDSLTQLQRLTEHIVSSIRSGLITTDLRGRVAVFNAAAKELTGRDPQEVIDKPVQALIGEAFWNRILDANFSQHSKPLRYEEWISLPNGAKSFLGFSASPLLDQNQQLLGYIISFQDLTEITRLEEEIRLKERMAAIGRMAAGIAHEIRNPLTAMRGSVEILRSHAKLPEKDDRLLHILIRESDRLNKFIEDFLSFARPRTYAKQWIDLVPVLRDSVTLLRNSPEIRDKYSVNLNIEAQAIRIFGSADQLNQVFWNVAQNAVRAMPKGGELNISIGKTSDGVGQVVFQDNGIGMSEEEKDQIFQPFHSGFAGGLGLGLSIIFQIMEDHQGRISFETEKGKGTKVSLNFPLEQKIQNAADCAEYADLECCNP
jgi:two-component system, NtrC family, sensor histidine kinase PilS